MNCYEGDRRRTGKDEKEENVKGIDESVWKPKGGKRCNMYARRVRLIIAEEWDGKTNIEMPFFVDADEARDTNPRSSGYGRGPGGCVHTGNLCNMYTLCAGHTIDKCMTFSDKDNL